MSENIFENNTHLDALLRDIKRRLLAHDYEIDERGMIVFGGHLGIKAGGVFDINAKRHEQVIRAMERGDKDEEWFYRNMALKAAPFTSEQWETIDAAKCPNLMPEPGINFYLNALVGPTTTKKSAWYLSAFKNNVTPDDTWDANWAGASSGPLGQEINATYVTATARLQGTFGTASAKTIAMSSAVEYTVKTAVTGLDVYGGTLNSSSTFGYNTEYDDANGHVLLASTKRGSAIQGLAAADKIILAYSLTGSST